MKEDMFYFSELQLKIINKHGNDKDLLDSLLVNCEQLIETYLKGLLKLKFGSYDRTHNLFKLCRTLDKPLSIKYESTLRALTSCYYSLLSPESDDYIDYSWDEFLKLKNDSLSLYKTLFELRKNMKDINSQIKLNNFIDNN